MAGAMQQQCVESSSSSCPALSGIVNGRPSGLPPPDFWAETETWGCVVLIFGFFIMVVVNFIQDCIKDGFWLTVKNSFLGPKETKSAKAKARSGYSSALSRFGLGYFGDEDKAEMFSLKCVILRNFVDFLEKDNIRQAKKMRQELIKIGEEAAIMPYINKKVARHVQDRRYIMAESISVNICKLGLVINAESLNLLLTSLKQQQDGRRAKWLFDMLLSQGVEPNEASHEIMAQMPRGRAMVARDSRGNILYHHHEFEDSDDESFSSSESSEDMHRSLFVRSHQSRLRADSDTSGDSYSSDDKVKDDDMQEEEEQEEKEQDIDHDDCAVEAPATGSTTTKNADDKANMSEEPGLET